MSEDLVRILIVEDDEDDYLLVRDLFEEIEARRFDITWAASYPEALAAMEQHPFDAYLFDYYLGEHTGMELLQACLSQEMRTPIIMLTGQGDRSMDVAAMEAGATDYLVKSQLNADMLERSVRYALARHQAEEALREAHEDLEQRVQERTAALAMSNEALQVEVSDRKRAEAALQEIRNELEQRVQDRTVALSVINELLQLEVDHRKQSEQVLRDSEANHRALLDAIPDSMIKVHRDGTVLEIRAEESMMGALCPIDGKPIPEVLPAHVAQLVMDYVGRALQKGTLQVFEYQVLVGEELRDFEARVVVSGEDETLCMLRDITERKRVDRLKNEFISVVSHELRTPLTSIAGSLALMSSGIAGALPAQAQTMIGIAHRNSERLVRLINDLLDLQKFESGTMPLKLQPVSLLSLIDQTLEANYAYGQRYGVSFELEGQPPDVWVKVDPDRLMQVMTNLLSNAAKFSPTGSTIRITVAENTDGVRVSVIDQGPGIPEEYHKRLFQKFVQVDASMSRHKEGSGLGLSICKSIIEMHGGRIGFDTKLGEGSAFYFELRALDGEEDTSTEEGTVSEDTPRLLICEDEEDIACLMQTLLQQGNFCADIASSAAEARRHLAENNYVAIILDLLLPDDDGVALLQEWRTDPTTRDVPIVVVSARAEQAREHFMGGALGLVDWLNKPLDIDRLRAAVNRVIFRVTERRGRILLVEDDDDVRSLVTSVLLEVADVVHGKTLEDARRRLREQPCDLIMLDLGLPDGRGLELLPVLEHLASDPIPVVIFSSADVDQTVTQGVARTLMKAQTSNKELVQVISTLLGEEELLPE
ncbi:MAG: response regulator [Rhodothermales bacterium]